MTEPWGNIVYNATITEETVSPLTVSLSNGATIVIAAGAFSGTTSVAVAADEDVYIDPTSINATISSTSGGGITVAIDATPATTTITDTVRSEEHTSELNSLMRISYAVFCLQKTKTQ